MRILVTGATGRVGGRVVARLDERADEAYALVRDSTADLPAHVHPIRADLTDPDSLTDLPEVDGVFLVFPSLQADEWAPQVIAALADISPQIVYLSAHGAEDAAGTGGIMGSHALLEGLIAESGMRWTFLRSSGFASNTLNWAPRIAAGEPVRWFAADARRALIHTDDLAAVGIRALIDGHRDAVPSNEALHLTGPQQHTQREYAALIGEVLGRPVDFVELDADQAVRELFGGLPAEFARSIIDGQAAMISRPEPVTRTVAEVLGHPALDFRRWVADHRTAFEAGGAADPR